MKRKAIKIALIDDHLLKCIQYYKKYNRLLQQAIIDKEDLSSPEIIKISERVDKLVKYLDNYIIYNNTKIE